MQTSPRSMPRSASPSSSSSSDTDAWLDVDTAEEKHQIVSLLDGDLFDDAPSMLEAVKARHGFDFVAACKRLRLDFYGAVKLVNFVRRCSQTGAALPDPIQLRDFEDDVNLQPVLPDDGLLLSLDEILPDSERADEPCVDAEECGDDAQALRVENRDLKEQLHVAQTRLSDYRLAVEGFLDDSWSQRKPESPAEGASSSVTGPARADAYSQAYATNDIHESMLKDSVRTDAYRDFIYQNKHLFQGKTVLDVGCGTGILSMFCAKAGAAKVLAVDRSDIIEKAVIMVFQNGLSDVISCIRGSIEEVKLPVEQVDVIVSEWMGYGLLFEAMLPSVIWARDRYLAPAGLMVPSHAVLRICPFSDSDYITESFAFWKNVYGFDMAAMQEGIYDEARVMTANVDSVCGSAPSFVTFDLYSVHVDDLSFTLPWSSKIHAEISALDGFLIWFDIFFAVDRQTQSSTLDVGSSDWAKSSGGIAFTTGPQGPETHWRQCLLSLKPEPSPQVLSEGTEIDGEISYSPLDTDARGLSIKLTWKTLNYSARSQTWKLQ